MDDTAQAAQTIAKFLQAFTTSGGLRLRFRVKARSMKPRSTDSAEISEGSQSGSPPPAEAKDGLRALYVEFTGPDTPLLTARNGELLNALEHISTKMLRLEPEEHDRVSFDADQFKANRDRQMRESAATAIERVRATGRPHPFPPMTSRERRMLHMVLSESGLPTASSGEGPGRFVVLYPKGADTSAPFNFSAAGDTQPAPRRHDANQVRNAFRPRY
jgi:spoIIIJ-associated protein